MTYVKLRLTGPDYFIPVDKWSENVTDSVEADEAPEGYLRLVAEKTRRGTPAEGRDLLLHVTVSGGVAVTAWEYVAAGDPRITVPLRTYRRSWLAQWLFAHDILDDFTVFLAEYPQMKMMWDYCTEFDSDHPMWPQFSAAVKAGLRLTDAEFAEFLSYGEHGK